DMLTCGFATGPATRALCSVGRTRLSAQLTAPGHVTRHAIRHALDGRVEVCGPPPGRSTGKGTSLSGFLAALAISFGVIFVAELGDKSELRAVTFATRFRTIPVLLGITAATAIVHAVSVGIGYGLGATLPTSWISLVAALAFFAFGAWTLRG